MKVNLRVFKNKEVLVIMRVKLQFLSFSIKVLVMETHRKWPEPSLLFFHFFISKSLTPSAQSNRQAPMSNSP